MSVARTPFGAKSTAAEVLAGVDLHGRRMIVTGGAAGIGLETARALLAAGADVTLAVRDVEAGTRAAAGLGGAVHVAALDLADRGSIARFAASWSGPLHVLLNNAGIMGVPEAHTAEGWELQFAVNHLGHVALALALHGALAAAGGARVVSVSSSAHLRSPVVFDDLHFDYRPYEPILAYAQSKTANVLFAVAAASRWSSDGIAVNALMPGAIATGLQRHLGGMKTPVALRKTPEQGAATSVLLAASPLVAGLTGRYFADCNEAERVPDSKGGMGGVAPYALDPDNAERLWRESLRLLG